MEWFLFCSFHFFFLPLLDFTILFKAIWRSSLTMFPIFFNRFDARAGIIGVRSLCYWIERVKKNKIKCYVEKKCRLQQRTLPHWRIAHKLCDFIFLIGSVAFCSSFYYFKLLSVDWSIWRSSTSHKNYTIHWQSTNFYFQINDWPIIPNKRETNINGILSTLWTIFNQIWIIVFSDYEAIDWTAWKIHITMVRSLHKRK